MASAVPVSSPLEVFQAQTEAICGALTDKYGKDVCLYSGLKVPVSEQVKLVVLNAKGTPRAVKQSCFSCSEALHLFIKQCGKDAFEPESKRLLLINGVSKVVNKDRFNTVRQVATARGKCSPFLSAEELQALEEARKAFIESEQASVSVARELAKAAKEKAKVDAELAKAAAKTKKAEEKAVAQVEGAAEETPKKKRSPKRKLEEEKSGEESPAPPAPSSGDEGSSKPKAKRVKKDKAPKKLPEILGQAPEESLSASVQWSGMAV